MEMANGSKVRMMIDYISLPFYDGALAMYRKGQTTGSNKANRQLVSRYDLEVRTALSSHEEELLYDPQTSGGLLLSLPYDQAGKFVKELQAAGNGDAVLIGEVTGGSAGIIVK